MTFLNSMILSTCYLSFQIVSLLSKVSFVFLYYSIPCFLSPFVMLAVLVCLFFLFIIPLQRFFVSFWLRAF